MRASSLLVVVVVTANWLLAKQFARHAAAAITGVATDRMVAAVAKAVVVMVAICVAHGQRPLCSLHALKLHIFVFRPLRGYAQNHQTQLLVAARWRVFAFEMPPPCTSKNNSNSGRVPPESFLTFETSNVEAFCKHSKHDICLARPPPPPLVPISLRWQGGCRPIFNL